MRAQAFWALGRHNDAKAAWGGALGRYEELGDARATAAIRAQLHAVGVNGEVKPSDESRAAEPVAQSAEKHEEAEAPT